MGKIIKLSVLLVFILCSISGLQAQYAIPSFDVALEEEGTTFEESQGLIGLLSAEERSILVEVEDNDPGTVSWAIVVIYSLDSQDELGPFTVTEGTLLKVTIDEREWGARVTDYLPGCIISTWIE